MKKVAIIGGGNLGKAIALGIFNSQLFEAQNIYVTRRHVEKLNALKEQGIQVLSDNKKAVQESDIVILCVKPYKTSSILEEIEPYLFNKALVSTVTGVSIAQIQEILGEKSIVVRAMPNTAISLGKSMTCLAESNADEKLRKIIQDIFSELGEAVYIDEELMGAATVLGASGIAFALRFIRAKMQAGIEIGFSSELALKIAAQTVAGAAALILEQNSHPEREIDKVTTPRGITISGLNKMEHHGFSSSLIQGILNSYEKVNI